MLFADAATKTIDFQMAPLFDSAGQVQNLIPSGILIEDRVQAEQARELLIGELRHRIKNLYAIANGMIQRSARGAGDMEALVKSVCGRLSAMAQAHDLIRPTEGGHQVSFSLRELALNVLPQHADSEDQIRLHGDSVILAGDAVTPMALVLHELATNASKYGALSAPAGWVELGWRLDGDRLILTWGEFGGPPTGGKPLREGFGSKLIRASTELQLRGAITHSWTETGCVVTLEIPSTALMKSMNTAAG